MSVIPAVRASLAERFIFNFRLPPQVLATYLPVPWLTPQLVEGSGIASFCILDLRGITVAPLTTAVGLDSISCAPRYAVLDESCDPASPAVFVTERQTNSAFGAWFTSLGFSAPHPHVEAVIEHQEEQTLLRVHSLEDGLLFAATVRPAPASSSASFASPQVFAEFIAQGVSSYGRSRHRSRLTGSRLTGSRLTGSRLTRVDLHKEDASYTPLAASNLGGVFAEEWQRRGGVFDSAFHTSGGRYEWTYRGMTA